MHEEDRQINNWKRKKSTYPNHGLLKKQRIKALKRDGWKCCSCKKRKATEAHHIDGSRDNHLLDNLLSLCKKCHMAKHAGGIKSSKYRRLYGLCIAEIASKLQCSKQTISNLDYNGELEEALRTGKWRKNKYRRLYGLTQEEIADRLMCSEPTVRKLYKTGRLEKLLGTKNLKNLQKNSSFPLDEADRVR